MADNTTLNTGSGGDTIATDDVVGVKYQRIKLVNGTLDATDAIPGDAVNGLDVDVTRVQGTVTVGDGGGSLTVDGTVTANAGVGPWPVTDNGGSLTVDGPLTDTQLRASAVPVSLASVSVTGPAADGAAVSGNPVRIGGKDGSGNTQDVLTDISGRLQVSLSRPWTNTGSYRAVTALLSVTATADAATAGRWWLINPVGSGVGIALLRVIAYFTIVTEVDMITAPRITLERVTFTGAASGASLTPSKRVRTTVQGQTLDAAAVGSVRTASTGLTLAAGEIEHAFLAPTYSLTTSGIGVSQPPMNVYGMSERGEDALILAAGEGIVCRQPDVGSTTDGRRFITIIEWEEFTT